MPRLKVLLYGDQNLNIMDGSAIWLTSLANILTFDGSVDLSILLKTPIKRNQVITNIKRMQDVKLINPAELKLKKKVNANRLSPDEASYVMQQLDRDNNYDLVITRGKELTSNCLKHPFSKKLIPYITDFSHGKGFSKDVAFFKKVYKRCPNIFVQTEEMKQFLAKSLNVSADKFITLPPSVADISSRPNMKYDHFSIVYTGKFAEQWETEALYQSYVEAKKEIDALTLNIAGDKFQGSLAEKKEELASQFENTKGINWVGAVSRDESMKLIEQSDLGFAYRSEEIDNDQSLELSTKFLEYGINGKPVVVRKTKQYVNLLGEDYPLYCNSYEELVEKVKLAFQDESVYQTAAEACFRASEAYQLSNVSSKILKALSKYKTGKQTILFAGHDFKFLRWYMDQLKQSGEWHVLEDEWTGHDVHDYDKSMELLKQADVIFCEWGLGNAEFYSHHKLRGQKLYIRVHRQEIMTNYLDRVNYDNVTNVITVSPYAFEKFHWDKKIPREKMKLVYNMVDIQKFNLPKKKDSAFNLGILGILPKLKRLDRAVNVFEKLWEKDPRYKLHIKGKLPQELPWLQNRPEEVEFFEAVFDKINNAPWKDNVIIDEYSDDVAQWFTNINFILSTSDVESFHLAPMEGMASGATPVIFNWPGANTIYPQKNVVSTEQEAVELILNETNQAEQNEQQYKNMVRKFDKEIISKQLNDIILQ